MSTNLNEGMSSMKIRVKSARSAFLALAVFLTVFTVYSPSAFALGTEPWDYNAAIGKPVYVSSESSSAAAINAVDGDSRTWWSASSGSFPQTLTVDMKDYHNINGIGIDYNLASTTAYLKYTVQVSTDNSTWTTVLDRSTNTNTDRRHYATFSNVTNQRYIKLTFTGGSSNQWASLAEFKVYVPKRGIPVGENRTAIASGYYDSSTAPWKANDGWSDTAWSADNGNTGHYLQVDLGRVYDLSGMQVNFKEAGVNYKYKVDLSLNATTWTTAVNNTSSTSTEQVQYATFTESKARYARITITGMTSGYWAGIREFKVYEKYWNGADISSLKMMEDNGAVYKDNGTTKDLLQLVKDNGVNYVRLKLWHNPGNAPISQPSWNTTAAVKEIALRVKNKGLKLLLDFHYSDQWADPGKQYVPAAWTGQTTAQLENSVYTYTKDVITQLKAQGTLPDMVQVGNEITNGFLWDYANVGTYNNDTSWTNFKTLLNAGLWGVKDALSSTDHVRLMIHVDKGADNSFSDYFYNKLINTYGVTEFDTIGFSYYHAWGGDIVNMKNNVFDIGSTYGKDIVLVEYAYPNTLNNADSMTNSVDLSSELSAAYPASAAGQEEHAKDAFSIIQNVPDGRGLGTFWWEPAWYALSGAGSMAGSGNEWDNMILFDQSGNKLSHFGSIYWRH